MLSKVLFTCIGDKMFKHPSQMLEVLKVVGAELESVYSFRISFVGILLKRCSQAEHSVIGLAGELIAGV